MNSIRTLSSVVAGWTLRADHATFRLLTQHAVPRRRQHRQPRYSERRRVDMKNYFLCFALLGVFSPAQLAAQAPPDGDPPVIIRPGDFIRLTVWDNPKYDGEFEIAPDSTVRHPLYRAIKAGGLPLSAVEQRFTEYLKLWLTDARVIVEARLRVALGGAVAQPNVYSFAPEVTVSRAILQAGGPVPDADMRKVRLLRDGAEQILDLKTPTSPDRDIRVRSGDQIVLNKNRSLLREVFGPIASVMSFSLLALTLYLRVFE